jgi:hypothetical protein
VLFKLMQRAA